jgi:glyoxylase-like metal-dependent hydrolase (beta-lactamase superfamily II)
MVHQTIEVGHVELSALLDVDVETGPIVEAFPDIDPDALLAQKARYPDVYGSDDAWRLRVRGWLVRHPGGLLLMDTGVGGPGSPTQEWCPAPGSLLDALAEVGAKPRDIDTLAISHVHDDHIGGLTDDDGAPIFGNARHLLQRADRDWQEDLARSSDEDRVIWERLLQPVERAGLLDLLDGNDRLSPLLELHHAPGHTPGHQVLRIASEGARALISADTFNHPAQFAHPDWPSGPDNDHAESAATRRAVLAELFSHPGTTVAPTHLGPAFGLVRSGRDGLAALEPIEP